MSEVVAYRDKAMVGSGSSDVMLDMRIPQKWSVHGTETALSHHRSAQGPESFIWLWPLSRADGKRLLSSSSRFGVTFSGSKLPMHFLQRSSSFHNVYCSQMSFNSSSEMNPTTSEPRKALGGFSWMFRDPR